MQDYLDPTGCPNEPPAIQKMTPATRLLHAAIDAASKKRGVPYLHPEDPSIQLDLLGSRHMITWQESKSAALFAGESCWSELPQIYGRYGVESTRQLIGKVRQLEDASAVVLTDCGMQACAFILDVLVQPRSHAIVMRQVYNKTKKHLEWLCNRSNATFEVINDGDLDALEAAVQPQTTVIFAETYTNPLTRALDPEALSALILRLREKRARRLRLVLDNTIASPWGVKRPLLAFDGIDVVVASGTKSLGGQDRDLWGYVASHNYDILNEIMDLQATRGGILDWRRASVIVDGLEESSAAFKQRCASAERVAGFLASHPRVAEVFHPSLPQHPDAVIVRKHYALPGSLLSFRIPGDEDTARHFADVLATCVVPRYALSFDGLTTKINHHPTVSEYFTPEDELKRCGFDRVLRLGVGLEAPEDVMACLNWALWNHDKVAAATVLAWQEQREKDLGITR